MQFDIYRRPEPDDKLSFLAVPAGKPIAPEAINTDWQLHASAQELDEGATQFAEYGIEAPARQLREKGYAITALDRQPVSG